MCTFTPGVIATDYHTNYLARSATVERTPDVMSQTNCCMKLDLIIAYK